MPIGYLVTTSFVGCGVFGALTPLRRPFILGALSFVAGFALNELPFIAAAWLVISTLLALDQTGLGSPVGSPLSRWRSWPWPGCCSSSGVRC